MVQKYHWRLFRALPYDPAPFRSCYAREGAIALGKRLESELKQQEKKQMIKYMRFDAVSFLKDSKKWEEEKRRKQEELDSITELPGMSNESTGRSGKISDSVFNVAARRERLEFEISRINTYQQALHYARKMLSDAQNEAIDVFFFRGGYIPPLIEEYGSKHGLCRSDVYSVRREALNKLSYIIEERYDL